MKLERIIEVRPAFDKRSNNPKKDYGIHGCEIIFVLKGEEGAVQFLLYTNWYLPHVQKAFEQKMSPENAVLFRPIPADLGYHSPKPMYKGQKPMGSTWVDMEAISRNLDTLKTASTLGIEPEETEEITYPTGVFDPCPYLDGKPCYYDGSGLAAERIYEIMLKEGSDGVWKALEKYYKDTFKETKDTMEE